MSTASRRKRSRLRCAWPGSTCGTRATPSSGSSPTDPAVKRASAQARPPSGRGAAAAEGGQGGGGQAQAKRARTDFIPNVSDLDFELYVRPALGDSRGPMPLEIGLEIQRELAAIGPCAFRLHPGICACRRDPRRVDRAGPGRLHRDRGKAPDRRGDRRRTGRGRAPRPRRDPGTARELAPGAPRHGGGVPSSGGCVFS